MLDADKILCEMRRRLVNNRSFEVVEAVRVLVEEINQELAERDAGQCSASGVSKYRAASHLMMGRSDRKGNGMARERRRNRPPRVTFNQIKANANEAAKSGKQAATKADLFMDWLTAQAEEVDDMLDHPRELGAYLKEVAHGFVEAMREDLDREGVDADNKLILDAAIQLIGTLIRAR